MRILITGATGLVGNNCLRLLAEQGHTIFALVRRPHDARPFEGVDVELCTVDLCAPDELRANLPQVDAIIHAAGDTHIGRQSRPAQFQVNVEATRVLAEIATEQQAKFVFVSSVDALPAAEIDGVVDELTEGNAKYDCGYVITKREAELAVQRQIAAGLNAVIVNPGFMLGPWDWKPSSGRMLLAVATQFTPFGPKGGFSVCDVRDVAAACFRVATQPTPHDRYILAGHNIRYVDAWRVFAKVTGGQGPLCPAGPLMRIVGGKWGDWMALLTGKEGDLNSAGVGMSDLFHYYDSGRAERELGYQIRPIEESASAAWAWFQQYGYAPRPQGKAS